MFVVFAVVALLAVPIALFSAKRKKQQLALAHTLAARHGFTVDPDDKHPPQQDFDLFGVGRSRNVSFHFWRADEQDSVFQYRYTTGSGKNSHTHHRTTAPVRSLRCHSLRRTPRSAPRRSGQGSAGQSGDVTSRSSPPSSMTPTG